MSRRTVHAARRYRADNRSCSCGGRPCPLRVTQRRRSPKRRKSSRWTSRLTGAFPRRQARHNSGPPPRRDAEDDPRHPWARQFLGGPRPDRRRRRLCLCLQPLSCTSITPWNPPDRTRRARRRRASPASKSTRMTPSPIQLVRRRRSSAAIHRPCSARPAHARAYDQAATGTRPRRQRPSSSPDSCSASRIGVPSLAHERAVNGLRRAVDAHPAQPKGKVGGAHLR